MPLSTVAPFVGVNAYPVKVEVDVSAGMPAFDIVGLPDASVKESGKECVPPLKTPGAPFLSKGSPSIWLLPI